ncbi:unnamed protein product [Blepharisma stoltei]|uniref:Uncharacterized protein n=1 Tax=Blepharisma stoltei TaxID=1481888 RepID=A0AAU9I892_9CILI|nr:unnamed protein product [Blepharisma stoltei]
MNAAIYQIQLNKERKSSEIQIQLNEKELSKYRKENIILKNEIESLKEEIDRFNGIIKNNNFKYLFQ